MKTVRTLVFLTMFLLFSGCFELLEEIWISPDGSARMKIDIGISEVMLSMGEGEEEDPFANLDEEFRKTKEEVEKNPGVKHIDFQQYSDGTLKHFVFDIEVSDYTALNGLPRIIYAENSTSKTPTESMFQLEESELLIERQGDGKVIFVRRFGQPEESDSLQDSGDMKEAMAGAMFGNYYYTVRLHADEIATTNGRVDETKKMVEWKTPIGLLMAEKKFKKEFRAEIASTKGNVLMWIVAVVLVGGIVGGIVVLVRKKKMVADTPQM